MKIISERINVVLAGCLLGFLGLGGCDEDAADEEQANDESVELAAGLEYLLLDDGREGYVTSDLAGSRALLDLAEIGEIEMEAAALAHLRRQIRDLEQASDDKLPRQQAPCPRTNATTKTSRVHYGIWGTQYFASAQWKKIGFGPHRSMRAEVAVCWKTDCKVDSQDGTPLDVGVAQMLSVPQGGSVSASAKIIDPAHGNCIASSSFQYWSL